MVAACRPIAPGVVVIGTDEIATVIRRVADAAKIVIQQPGARAAAHTRQPPRAVEVFLAAILQHLRQGLGDVLHNRGGCATARNREQVPVAVIGVRRGDAPFGQAGEPVEGVVAVVLVVVSVRVSPALRALIDQVGPVNAATRALIILGAESAGFDLMGMEREVAVLLTEELGLRLAKNFDASCCKASR